MKLVNIYFVDIKINYYEILEIVEVGSYVFVI